MERLASLLRGAWEWVQTLDLCSAAAERERARVRLQVEDEQAKPAGERNERRLLALRKEDNRLHLAYYAVRAPKTRVWVSCAEFCRVPPSSRRLRRTAPFPGPLPSLLGLQHLDDGWKVAEEKCQALSQRSDGRGCCKASA